MRARATLIVVTGLTVLAVAAAVDVLRPEGGTGPSKTEARVTTIAADPEAVAARLFARYGISGTLYLTVRAGSGCDYRAVALPRLAVTSSGRLSTCRFQVSPDGRHVAELRECPARTARVFDVIDPSRVRTFAGCAPAWNPRVDFTYFSGGAVVAADIDCLGTVGCPRVLVPRRALARGAAVINPQLGSAAIAQIEWVTDSRVAVVVRVRRNRESIVFFEGTRSMEVVDFPFAPHPHIEVLPHRREILIGGRGQGLAAFSYAGTFRSATRVRFADTGAVAASPDGRWLALARPGNVCIHAQGDPGAAVDCIAADAQDLAWR